MRLVTVPEPPGYGFVARCLTCKRWIPAGTTKIADLDGKAYEAYYHTTCVPEGVAIDHDHNHNQD
jgi:hypothetical protein